MSFFITVGDKFVITLNYSFPSLGILSWRFLCFPFSLFCFVYFFLCCFLFTLDLDDVPIFVIFMWIFTFHSISINWLLSWVSLIDWWVPIPRVYGCTFHDMLLFSSFKFTCTLLLVGGHLTLPYILYIACSLHLRAFPSFPEYSNVSRGEPLCPEFFLSQITPFIDPHTSWLGTRRISFSVVKYDTILQYVGNIFQNIPMHYLEWLRGQRRRLGMISTME